MGDSDASFPSSAPSKPVTLHPPARSTEKHAASNQTAPFPVRVDNPAMELPVFASLKPQPQEGASEHAPAFSRNPAAGVPLAASLPELFPATAEPMPAANRSPAPESIADSARNSGPGPEIETAAVPQLAFQARLIPEGIVDDPVSTADPMREPAPVSCGPVSPKPVLQQVVPVPADPAPACQVRQPAASNDHEIATPTHASPARLPNAAPAKPAENPQADVPDDRSTDRPPDSSAPVSSARNAASGGNPGESREGQTWPAPADGPGVSSVTPAEVLFVPPASEPPVATSPSAPPAAPLPRAEVQPEILPQPVSRDLALRLEGQSNVDIRMTERAGEVRVTVHTTDADLAGSLRSDLPELLTRLRQSGFQAEAWRPAGAVEAGVAGRSPADLYGSAQDTREGWRQGRQQPQHPRQPRNSARWTGEWNASLDLTEESQT